MPEWKLTGPRGGKSTHDMRGRGLTGMHVGQRRRKMVRGHKRESVDKGKATLSPKLGENKKKRKEGRVW